ncbi:MAG: GNAT family N-acetyltransferase [Bacteroidales bacterium]|nr:GNAT family N-acetyltransferase [Bacteroidales bacterium]
MYRILLRAPEPDDLDLLYIWENDQSLWQLSNTVAPLSRFVLRQYLENAHKDIYEIKQLRLMIELEQEGFKTAIGAIDLFDFDPAHARAGVGILIASEGNRKNGYASQALEKLIDYAFNTLMLKQLFCNILPDNLPSIAVFEKFGFRQCGLKKDWVKTIEGFKDELMYQLINERY